MYPTRRNIFAAAAGLATMAVASPRLAWARPLDFDTSKPFSDTSVADMARDLAMRAFVPAPTVPQPWLDVDYNQYRNIWFNPASTLWKDSASGFEAQFFPPGFYFREGVQIHVVDGGTAKHVAFDTDHFIMADNVPALPSDPSLGFSGFRLHTPINTPDHRDEFVVFQGASYFRGVARGQKYGLSARGLAVNTAEPAGEEFPTYRSFWIERPASDAGSVRVHALLDSPSVTGAYRFDIVPGDETVMDVRATVFPRTDMAHVGIAPLTSMFLYDETNRVMFDDFRPGVHDSDGLLIANGAGEQIWRPLANPKSLQVSQFMDNNPRGFGLMQRSRSLGQFADLEAYYERRPSAWVEPVGDWGRGSVTLVEIPTRREINDNIVAYWRPIDGLAAGSETTMNYRLAWCWEAPQKRPLARVVNTRMGARRQIDAEGRGRLIVIDFAGPEGVELPDPDAIMGNVWSRPGTVSKPVIQRNPETGGIRMGFTFEPGDPPYAELRAQLRHDGNALSEAWLYRWTG